MLLSSSQVLIAHQAHLARSAAWIVSWGVYNDRRIGPNGLHDALSALRIRFSHRCVSLEHEVRTQAPTRRPSGMRAEKAATAASGSGSAAAIVRANGVSVGPGQIAVTRMPCRTYCNASVEATAEIDDRVEHERYAFGGNDDSPSGARSPMEAVSASTFDSFGSPTSVTAGCADGGRGVVNSYVGSSS